MELFGRVVGLHVDARVDRQRQLGAPQLRALLRQRALHALHTASDTQCSMLYALCTMCMWALDPAVQLYYTRLMNGNELDVPHVSHSIR